MTNSAARRPWESVLVGCKTRRWEGGKSMTTLGTWNNPGLLAPRLLTNCPQLFVSPPCVARSCSSMSPPHQAKAYFRDRWHLLLTKRVTTSSYFCKRIVPLPPIVREVVSSNSYSEEWSWQPSKGGRTCVVFHSHPTAHQSSTPLSGHQRAYSH